METIPNTQYAYLAGLVDGEGTISIYLNQRGYYITHTSITLTSEDLILWLQETFDGNVHHIKNDRKAEHQERWKWQISSTLMRTHLPSMLPYLRLKRRHAEIALEFLSGRRRGTNITYGTEWQTVLYEEIRVLNLRGKAKIEHDRTAKAEFLERINGK